MATPKSITHGNKTYGIKSLMTWDEVERTEDLMDPSQLNAAEEIKAAKTKEDRANIAAKIRKATKEQMTHVKNMLLGHLQITEDELKKMAFIDAMLIFGEFYKKSTDVSDFLEPASEQQS